MGDQPVYSTATGSNKKAGRTKEGGYVRGAGPARMRLESKGRGGKKVTVLFDLPMEEGEARQLMKDMQTRFGCGATLKDSTIELRGDLRDKVEEHFRKLGQKLIRAGG